MGEDELIKALEEQTRLETEAIVDQGRAEVEATVREAREAVTRRHEDKLAELERTLERERIAVVNSEKRLAHGRLLETRTRAIEGVMERTLGELSDGGRYREIWALLYSDLKRAWVRENRDMRARVHVNPTDKGLVDDLEAEVVLDENVRHGVVFISVDGRLRYENTLGSRMEMARRSLMSALDGFLLDGRGGGDVEEKQEG